MNSNIILAEVEDIKLKYPERTWEELADHVFKNHKLFLSGNALRKRYARYIGAKNRLKKVDHGSEFPIPFVKEYDDFIVVPYDDCMVINDVHIPFYLPELADKMLEVAKKFNIKKLFIPGDLFDLKALSSYMSLYDMDSDAVEYELDMGNEFLKVLGSWFDDIYISTGNHEARIEKRLEKKIGFRTLLRLVLQDVESTGVKIHVSNYPMMRMKGKNNPDIIFGHPNSYSRIKGNVPRDLCTKYQASVITGHTHHAVLTTHISGKFFIMESGCLADPDKQEYLAHSLTAMPVWTPGFGMVRNEVPYLFFEDPMMTDWNFWLGGENG